MLRIAIAQVNPIVGDLSGNSSKIELNIKKASQKQADIVLFPELAVCGYPPEDLLYKEYFVRDNILALKNIAKTVKDITVVIGFADRNRNKKLYNAVAVIQKTKVCYKYYKQALPNYGVFDEKRYFTRGNDFKLVRYGPAAFGISICEDIWLDKGVYQNQSKLGANILLNVSSSPFSLTKVAFRQRMLKKRARETGCYVCYANLVGGQDELIFDGNSMIIDPQGKVVACAKAFEEDLVFADIDIQNKETKSKSKSSFIRLAENISQKKVPIEKRKQKKSTKIETVYKALVMGTHDYVRKNGFDKVVIGLSGGIDSSVVAAIAVSAIGKDNVVGVTMPSKFTSSGTKSDAELLADNLGIRFIDIPIDGIYLAYEQSLKKEFMTTKIGVAEENIQARIRGNLLMYLSNKFGWLVLTTGNKSEIAVGYCTLYGDMSGGFGVIKDIPKTMVYELAGHINSLGCQVIPQSVIKRAPSAELRQNQKDQDSLPPYDVLDLLLEQYVEEHKAITTQSKSYKKETAQQVVSLVDKSEYKRRQSPPGIKITERAFGKDWRLPITNKYKAV